MLGAGRRLWNNRLPSRGSLRPSGDVAEGLGSGLQSRLHQFDSGRRLLIIGAASRRVLPRFSYTKRFEGFAMHELCNIAKAVHMPLLDAC